MARWWLGSLAVVALALLTSTAAACSSSDDGGISTSTATSAVTVSMSPTATPAPPPLPTAPATTGIASVDAAIAAVEVGDIDALMQQVTYTKQPCIALADVQPLEGRPVCRSGESTGDLVDDFAVGNCEGGVIRRENPAAIRQALETFLHGPLRFYGAYKTIPSVWGAGKYVAVFHARPGGPGLARVAMLDDAGIVGAATGCGSTPEQLAANQTPLVGVPTSVP